MGTSRFRDFFSARKADWPSWLWVVFVLLATGIIRYRFLDVPLERDEGEFGYMGRLILEGNTPYTLAYNMKFPGVYYLFALSMRLFGQTVPGIHAGLWVANAVGTVLMYRLGKRLLDAWAGAVACAVYGLMTVSPSLLGTSAHATQFLAPFMLGGILLLAGRGDRPGRAGLWAGGALLGLAVLVKQHGALFPVGAALAILLGWLPAQGGPWRRRLADALVLLAGTAVPLVLTGAALLLMGCFPRFWFWTFTYARHYVVILTPAEAWQRFITCAPEAMVGWTWVLVASAAGMAALFLDPDLARVRRFLLLFFVFSFLSVCPGFYFRAHYFVTLVPALALLCACAASSLARFLQRRWAFRHGGALACAAAVIIPLVWFRGEFFFIPGPVLSRVDYPESCFPEMRDVGEHLKAMVSPGEKVAILGSEPEILFYAHCRSATGIMYTYPLMERQPLARGMQEEMVREIEACTPRYIVSVNNLDSWAFNPDSDPFLLAWFRDYIKDRYRVVGITESFPLSMGYQAEWGAGAASRIPTAPIVTRVLKRI